MTNNLTPYIALALAVAASLAWKGYIKLPVRAPAAPAPGPTVMTAAGPSPAADADELSRYGSHVLGLAFAKAKRREAEEGLAEQIARQAGETIHATFTAPFSPAPAGPDPNQAGARP